MRVRSLQSEATCSPDTENAFPSNPYAERVSTEEPARQTRAEQRAATRMKLLEAGVKAFAEKGHDGVNLAKDILDPVGISVGSFYHQFDNKTELLVAIIELATEVAENRFLDSLPSDGSGMNRDAIAASWDAYLSLVDRRADVVTIQLRETHSPHPEIADAIQRLTEARRRLLAARYQQIALADSTIDTDGLADMVEQLALGALTNYLRTPEAERPIRKVELTERLTTMTIAAIEGFSTPTS